MNVAKRPLATAPEVVGRVVAEAEEAAGDDDAVRRHADAVHAPAEPQLRVLVVVEAAMNAMQIEYEDSKYCISFLFVYLVVEC